MPKETYMSTKKQLTEAEFNETVAFMKATAKGKAACYDRVIEMAYLSLVKGELHKSIASAYDLKLQSVHSSIRRFYKVYEKMRGIEPVKKPRVKKGELIESLLGVNLISSWIEIELETKNQAEALRMINAETGMNYTNSHLYEWLEGQKVPRAPALNIMLETVLNRELIKAGIKESKVKSIIKKSKLLIKS